MLPPLTLLAYDVGPFVVQILSEFPTGRGLMV